MEEFMEDVSCICEIILEECKRGRRRDEIMKMFPLPEQAINTILEFLCETELLRREGETYKITEAGKEFLELPTDVEEEEGGGDEYA